MNNCKFCKAPCTEDDFQKYVDGGIYACGPCADREWAKAEHEFNESWTEWAKEAKRAK